MTKIKICSGRSTKIIEVNDDATKWTGSEFKKIQEARKEMSKNKYISVGRCIRRIKFDSFLTTSTKSIKSIWISSGQSIKKKNFWEFVNPTEKF